MYIHMGSGGGIGTDLDELALLRGGAGADDAVAEAEPGGRHLERALPGRRLRRNGREEAGQDGPGQNGGHGVAPAEDQSVVGLLRGRAVAARRRLPRGVRLWEAQEEAGQRRGGCGCGRSHGYPTDPIGAVEECGCAPMDKACVKELRFVIFRWTGGDD